MSCPVCICRYRKRSAVAAILCPRCGYTSCATCVVTWFAQAPGHGCISCRLVFTDSFIFAHVPKKLQKDYDAALAAFKFAADRANIPTTRRAIARKFEIDDISRRAHVIYKQINAAEFATREHKLDAMYLRAGDQSAETKQRLKTLMADIRTQAIILDTLRANNAVLSCEYRRVKMAAISDMADPVYCGNVSIACVGVLDATLQCAICAYVSCRQCGASYPGTDAHTCAPGDIATIALLRHDTKPCPRCLVPIYKTSGCDHMWCPRCHAEFDWRTLAIGNPGWHNPDRIEYLARLRRLDSPPEDMLCDVLSAGYRGQYRPAGYPALCRGIAALRDVYRTLLPVDDAKYADLLRRFLLSGVVHPATAHTYPIYREAEYLRDITKIIRAARWAQIQADILYMCYAGTMSLMGELTERDTCGEMRALRKLANTELKRAAALFAAPRCKLSKLADARPLEYLAYTPAAITAGDV